MPGWDHVAAKSMGARPFRLLPILLSTSTDFEPKDARYLMVHRGDLMSLRPEEEPLVTGAAIRALTFHRHAGRLVEGVRNLKPAGSSSAFTSTTVTRWQCCGLGRGLRQGVNHLPSRELTMNLMLIR